RRLEALGFDWDPIATQWEAMYKTLVAYKKRFGDCNVPAKWKEDRSLGMWVSGQRDSKARDLLSSERIRRLETLGFDWDARKTQWETMYKQLVAYKKRFGDCNVPARWKEDRSLGMWVSGQRQLKSKDQLPSERVRQLESLGFDWNPFISSWAEMYGRLVAFKQQHRHCNVPVKSKGDQSLGQWVFKQRQKKEKAQLPLKRIQQLNKLDFNWDQDSRRDRWEEMYARLLAYKKKHKDCNVPAKWKQDYSLGRWVSVQRQFRVNDRLSSERIRRLDALGFNWDPLSAQWEEMFKRLAAYKKQYRHCNVPHLWEQDRSLGGWVAHQRQPRANDQLSPERIRRLETLGFAWRLRARKKRKV
ncbi:MAG: helicase associated domain-containing protein, partial [Nitrospiraceae bacterium]|nr:helicase associated domain-containing protein [Nitrospiraceae bacterium]